MIGIVANKGLTLVPLKLYSNKRGFVKIEIGVGKGKAEKYGHDFIKLIKKYVEEDNIIRAQDYVIKSKANKNDLNYISIEAEAKEIYKFDFPNQQGGIQIPISSLIKVIEN